MDVLRGLTTSQWAALSPAVSYFCGSLFFQTLETFKIGEQYRLVPTDEELKRNRVSRAAVIAHALVYHSITTTLALIFVDLFPPLKECQHCFGSYSYFETSIAALLGNKEHGSIQLAALSWLARLIYLGVRQFGAFFIFDTWLYWTHYFSHHNRWWFSKTNYPVSTTIDPTSGNSCPIYSQNTSTPSTTNYMFPSLTGQHTITQLRASALMLSPHSLPRVACVSRISSRVCFSHWRRCGPAKTIPLTTCLGARSFLLADYSVTRRSGTAFTIRNGGSE